MPIQRYNGFCVLWLLLVSAALSLRAGAAETIDDRARAFIAEHEQHVRPLEIAVNLAWWKANTTGRDEDFAAKVEAQNALDAILAEPLRFERLKAIHQQGPADALLARQIEVLHLVYLEKQVPPELLQRITSKANAIEKKFNVFRAQVGDQLLSDSEVRGVLSKSTDGERRRAVWEASKRVGAEVESELKELVLLRNEAAERLGFANYHTLQLTVSEHDPEQVIAIFDELDELTRAPFAAAKADIDRALAANYGISVGQLRPWHYQDPFFQEAPDLGGTSLDAVFANVNIEAVCSKFYRGIDLPIDDVLSRSDLYEKPGKSPHAFCTDIDRAGDVRVLANIVPNEYWMTTMLHELGHAVYSSKNIPSQVPYALRSDAHILATEGVAMMFERFAGSAQWLGAMGVNVPDPEAYNAAAALARRNKLLIFSRWCQVMLRFEKAMYEDPAQDLNQLWWDLVEKYQMVRRPEGRSMPDYASKIHVVSAPCYYHNYMLGELFACQLHHALVRQVLDTDNPATAIYYDNPQVGQFMRDKVFSQGRVRSWNALTEYATGQPLNAQAFAEEVKGR